MKVQAIIFDMDGTIFDTERLLMRSWQEAVNRGTVPSGVLDEIPKWRGFTRDEVAKKLRELYGADFPSEQLSQQRREIIRELLDREGVPLKSGVPQVFDELQELGIPMALATATSAPSVNDYMRRTGYGKYFRCRITGDRVPKGKPAPDIFLLAAQELGITPENCVVIEDSPNGVRAGVAAGMRTIMIPDMEQPDDSIRGMLWHCCDTLAEIPALIKQEL